MNIGLDKSSKKFECPACGKKRLVKYLNFETNEYLPPEYGRCDREMKCGYHNSGFNHFKNSNVKITYTPTVYHTTQFNTISISEVKKHLVSSKNCNHFLEFLNTIFDYRIIQQLKTEYLIGTSNHWAGSTIFWQVDQNKAVRSGKIILYNSSNGKRIKKPYPHISWFHKTEKIADFSLKQCLFGLHLIKKYPRKPIAVVESEKTAVIMCAVMPDYLWLATGSLSNLKPELFQPLYNKKIVLYPDASSENSQGHTCYDLWQKKAENLRAKGFDIETSNILEKKASLGQKKAGLDIADFFISQLKYKKLTQKYEDHYIEELKSPNQIKFNKLKSINPNMELLRIKFDLEIG